MRLSKDHLLEEPHNEPITSHETKMGKAKGHLLQQACASGPPYATFMMLLPLFWRSNGATSLFGLFLKGLELQEH